MKVDLSDCGKSRDEVVHIIEQWVIGPNAERDRRILVRALVDGVPYEPLEEELQVSVSTIKRVISKNAYRVLKHV